MDEKPITPPCWNRPPFAEARTLHGIDETTGEAISITLRNDWFEDRCRTWEGVGIGAPTPEYPSGTPYPIAHGWDKACATCRWMPKQPVAVEAPSSEPLLIRLPDPPVSPGAGPRKECWCLTCRPITRDDPYSMRMAVCPTCGFKRCPRANSCANACTGSNEPGQPGSAYPARPKDQPNG